MSVASTCTICIVPVGQVLQHTNVYLAHRPRRRRRGRCLRPLGLEQLAQPLLRAGQRNARDDRLEEAEHDELARQVARQAAAHQVEDLRLIDRADRAGVGCSPDVGLVDLETGDGHRARLLGQQHGELAQEAVRTAPSARCR
jgi:hypothetical protein